MGEFTSLEDCELELVGKVNEEKNKEHCALFIDYLNVNERDYYEIKQIEGCNCAVNKHNKLVDTRNELQSKHEKRRWENKGRSEEINLSIDLRNMRKGIKTIYKMCMKCIKSINFFLSIV